MDTDHHPDIEQQRLLAENARLRGDLLTVGSRVNHDLRTPLGSIVSTAELLKEIIGDSEPSAAPLIDMLFSSADEITKIMRLVSLLTKATARPVSKRKIKTGEPVSRALQKLERRILEKKAEVALPDDWPECDGVDDWLEFIWFNFLINALQHGGPKIQLGWSREKAGFRFWIRDSGPGVPKEAQADLFQPFDSLHRPGSKRGLGLSVVQRLVELQGGRCRYEAGVGGSPVFCFTLPESAE